MIEWGEPRAAWMAGSSPARTNRMALRTNSMRYAVVIEKGERNDSACAGARDVESARRAWRSLPRMRRLRGVPNAPTSNAIPAAPRRDAAENGSVMAVPGLDPGIVQAIDWRQTVMAGLVVPCAGHPRCGARMSGGWVYIRANRSALSGRCRRCSARSSRDCKDCSWDRSRSDSPVRRD